MRNIGNRTNQPFTPLAIRKVYEEDRAKPGWSTAWALLLDMDVKTGNNRPHRWKGCWKRLFKSCSMRKWPFRQPLWKGGLYKETFLEIVFPIIIKYRIGNEEQGWLEPYGLIKKKEDKAIVANKLQKKDLTETFFHEADNRCIILRRSSQCFPGGYWIWTYVSWICRYISPRSVSGLLHRGETVMRKTRAISPDSLAVQFVKGGH